MHPGENAEQLIREKLATGNWQVGERLPSLAKMAMLFTVSRATMWRVIRILKKESLVHTTMRGSIYAGPEGSTPSLQKTKLQKWEQLKEQIGRDVLLGDITGPFMPPANKLCLQYGVSFVTLKKILPGLAREGLLIQKGHRYALPRKQGNIHASTIAFISGGPAGGDISITDDRTRGIMGSLERECQRLSFERIQISFDEHAPMGLLAVSTAVTQINNLAGFIVNVWNPWDEPLRKSWFDLLQFLSGKMLPVIAIDQSGNFNPLRELTNGRSVRVLRIAGFRAGEMIAENLIRKGYRHIAYIAPDMKSDWARNRYEGLCRFTASYAGPDTRAELCEQGGAAMDTVKLVLEFLDLDERSAKSLFKNRFPTSDINSFYKARNTSGRKRHITLARDDLEVQTIRSQARHLSILAAQRYDPAVFDRFYSAFFDRASTYAFDQYLHPLFEKVLFTSKSSVWVCSDDKVALSALSFLTNKKIAVPGKIAIAGFNNWTEDYAAGLTSYDFNMHGMVQESLHLIMDEKALKQAPVIREVDGYVVERRSTRK